MLQEAVVADKTTYKAEADKLSQQISLIEKYYSYKEYVDVVELSKSPSYNTIKVYAFALKKYIFSKGNESY